MIATGKTTKRFSILGVPISVVNMPAAVSKLIEWANHDVNTPRQVFVREVASLMLAVDNKKLMDCHSRADLVVPDGMPLAFIGKMKGHGEHIGRVAGADLVESVCEATAKTGHSHYFYGGKHGVAQKMADRLQSKYPGLKIAGVYSPPMREIDADKVFDEAMLEEVKRISLTKPSFIWIGISSPKQEFWMSHASPLINSGIFIGVGAAFDFISGEISRAPKFMRNSGLEWLHRLCSEPRRLWRRYLILVPRFLMLLAVSIARHRTIL